MRCQRPPWPIQGLERTTTAAMPAQTFASCRAARDGRTERRGGTRTSLDCTEGPWTASPTVARSMASWDELIAHEIVVVSGKGGVGKSTVAAALALAAASRGRSVLL